MSVLSIQQAMQITGKSRSRIYSWRKAGVDVTNRETLLEYNDFMDSRSRGDSRKKVAHRLDSMADRKTRDLSGYFSLDTPSDAFVNLPAPCEFDSAITAVSDIVSAFADRLAEVRAIGHANSILLAERDLELAESALKSLTLLAGGFEE